MNFELNIVKIEILKKFPTQSDFAEFMGIHESRVSQVLKGRRKLRPDDAEKWRKTLNCDPKILAPVTK